MRRSVAGARSSSDAVALAPTRERKNTRVAPFPRRPPTCPRRLHPRGSRLMDWLSDGPTYCFLSQHTHTRREMDAVRVPPWLNSLSGSLCDLCAADFSRNTQHEAIKQQADGPPARPHVTEVRACPSIRKRSKVSRLLFANHQSCASSLQC